MTSMSVRVAHTVASIADASAGPSYSVTHLCHALATHDAAVTLHSVQGWRTDQPHSGAETAKTSGLNLATHKQDFANIPLMKALCLSRALNTTLRVEPADIFHTHGLWLMPNIYPARVASAMGKPFVVSPRGMLGAEALRFSANRKRILWYLSQRSALLGAACLHATSEAECDEIRAAGLTNPVAIIPNGVDLPPLVPLAPNSNDRVRTVLSLGRIHPKKGLDRLLAAWAQVEPSHPQWRLRIVGPDDGGHVMALKELAARLKLQRTTIEPPVAGDAKITVMQEADLFVLPSLNENFALTVSESLAAGTPVISTKGAPWAGLEAHGCGWWVDHGVEPLAATLRTAMALPDEARADMGKRGREWMARDFSWDKVASQMSAVYKWLACSDEQPSTVCRDE